MGWKNDYSRITAATPVFWFRRDLRLKDNAGLYYALKAHHHVVPVFIFDTQILDRLEDRRDARVAFILDSIAHLDHELRQHGSSLLVLHGDPVSVFAQMPATVVYTNRDYEPYAAHRDRAVSRILENRGGELKRFKDQVIFDHGEILKSDGKPYTVFTPYSNRCKAKLNAFFVKSYPTEKYAHHLLKFDTPGVVPRRALPTLKDIGFSIFGDPSSPIEFPPRIVRTGVVEHYDQTRNFPAMRGTTRLSVHLRFGTISIRALMRLALKKNKVWLDELIWREFYQMILYHFPHVETQSFKPAYDRIVWQNNVEQFEAWCEGRTGYPLVDAGMRELNETGFMHNRVRMVTASFLTKHLLIDWRWGEAYFAKKLLDYDMAANNGGWQWAAGSGCDAAPYFRVFNPELQRQKFDPEFEYVMQWVPEFQSSDYPRPIVDHVLARDRALKTYRAALR